MFAISEGVNVNMSSVVLGGWKLETNVVGTVGSNVVVDVSVDVRTASVVTCSSFVDAVNSSVDNDVDLDVPSVDGSLELTVLTTPNDVVVSVLDKVFSMLVLLTSMSLVECNGSVVVLSSSIAVVMSVYCVLPEVLSLPKVELVDS